jgi:Tol biopolymer transport system component
LAVGLAVVAAAAPVALGAHSSAAGGTTVLVSRASGQSGAGGDGNSVTPSISANGRFVAFASRAKNLTPADHDTQRDIFVRDMKTGATTLVSRASGANGANGNGLSLDPSISADGRYVAFASLATNLSPDDSDALDIFVRDRVANTTELVSRATGAGGAAADEFSTHPSISADGRHVAFESQANNLSADDVKGSTSDIFVRNLDPQTTALISRASGPNGPAGTDLSFDPSISADGRYVAFESRAPLGTDDVDDSSFEGDVFVRDRLMSLTILVSRKSGAAGAPSEVESSEPSISADGRHVAFKSDAKLTTQKFFGPNVFVRDLDANTTQLVSVGDEDLAGDAFREPSISADGRYVAFHSRANQISPADADAKRDVFVRDMQAGLTVVVSRASGRLGLAGDGPSANPSISADGLFVAFDSRATNFSGADDDKVADVFRRKVAYLPDSPPPKCHGRSVTKVGTPGRDVINGTPRTDVVLALGGDDVIRTFDRPDAICAGTGDDRVFAGTNGGGGGSDLVLGGAGRDRIVLGPELGRAFGDAGNDVLIGSKGGDALYGGAGNDVLRGLGNPPFNSDFLFGGPGNDVISGGPGPDNIRGGAGVDQIDGDGGSNDIKQ